MSRIDEAAADKLIGEVEAEQAEAVAASAEPPTYPIGRTVSTEEGRRLIAQAIDDFLRAAEKWHADCALAAERRKQGLQCDDPAPPVHAIQVTTGGGKTDGVEIAFGADRARRRAARETGPMAKRPLLWMVPHHKLNEEIKKGCREQGLDARIFRGRDQPDPADADHPAEHEQRLLCLQPAKVKQAQDLRVSIAETCCYSRTRGADGEWIERKCSDYPVCGYYLQLANKEPPDAWLTANTMLFHPQSAFGEVCAIVIDEAFWQQGLVGVAGDGHRLDDLYVDDVAHFGYSIPQNSRRPLLDALKAQESDGGLLLASLPKQVTEEHCTRLHKAEWQFIDENTKGLGPDMSAMALKAIEKKGPELRRARFMAGLYNAVRTMIREGIEASGHVVIDTDDGHRVVRLRGVHEVVKKWQRPTLIMDATLPPPEILRVWYPQVEVAAEIDIEAPHQQVRQVIDAPIAIGKLFKPKEKGKPREPKPGARNLRLLRHKIIELWLSTGKVPTLVICQLEVERWLKAQGLPPGISIVHFNDFTGLDEHKDAGHIIMLGRTAPNPRAVEAMVGAMTGREPIKVPKGERWYGEQGRVRRRIALAGGGSVSVRGDQHPDPLGEMVRWQVCEAGVIQGIGRGRGVHRTASNPLVVTILNDVCVPPPMEAVQGWRPANPVVEMLKAGFLTRSPKDMMKIWNKVWSSVETAKRNLQAFFERSGVTDGQNSIENLLYKEMTFCSAEDGLGGWLPIFYRRAAPKVKNVLALHDPAVVPNPREFLEAEGRLGQMAALSHLVGRPHLGDLAGAGYLRADVKKAWRTPVIEEAQMSAAEVEALWRSPETRLWPKAFQSPNPL